MCSDTPTCTGPPQCSNLAFGPRFILRLRTAAIRSMRLRHEWDETTSLHEHLMTLLGLLLHVKHAWQSRTPFPAVHFSRGAEWAAA